MRPLRNSRVPVQSMPTEFPSAFTTAFGYFTSSDLLRSFQLRRKALCSIR
jgi:hypothetical protein